MTSLAGVTTAARRSRARRWMRTDFICSSGPHGRAISPLTVRECRSRTAGIGGKRSHGAGFWRLCMRARSGGRAARRGRDGGRRPDGRPSLSKMLETCFSTARSVITSSLRDPLVRAALGHQLEHLALARGELRRAGRRSRRLREQRRRRPSGSSAEPPSATRRTRRGELLDVGDAVLEQVADALGASRPSSSSARPTSTYWESTSTPTSGCAARISSAARRPSSVWVGGIRMSTIATSGLCARTCAQQLVGVAGLSDDLEAGFPEQARDALAQQHAVVGDDDAHGISARTLVPPPGGLQTRAARRAPRPGRPARAARSRARVGATDAVVGDLDDDVRVAARHVDVARRPRRTSPRSRGLRRPGSTPPPRVLGQPLVERTVRPTGAARAPRAAPGRPPGRGR